MERVFFPNSRNKLLAGNLYPSDSGNVIILCHGLASDQISRGRSQALVQVFNQSGFGALTFDFSGCGESGDDSITIDKETDNLYSAVEFIKSKSYDKIALYGHSLGGLICLKCFKPGIAAIAVSGALTGPMKYNLSEYYSEDQLRELELNGCITEIKTEGQRKKVIIDKQVFQDIEAIDQKELFKNIACPVLMIHGDGDEEERLLALNSEKALRLLPAGSRLEIIDGAGHSFIGYYDALIGLVNGWFMKHFQSQRA